jgi:hypothetical protein
MYTHPTDTSSNWVADVDPDVYLDAPERLKIAAVLSAAPVSKQEILTPEILST